MDSNKIVGITLRSYPEVAKAGHYASLQFDILLVQWCDCGWEGMTM